nr:MFS transporter [Aphanothece sp. CMT-3BRIN-NPC111]
LVPQRLRGRYFGTRNSAISLTTLLSVPLFGLAVSAWPGGTIQGYGVLLFLGVAIGLISLGCQVFMADVNPQQQASEQKNTAPLASSESGVDPNFLRFLLYFGFWAFAVNVGNPFFNLYLLDNLSINVSWVTLYGSLTAGASLLMMIVWGKLADQIGNRPLLILVGVLVALTPLLWLGIGTDVVSLWVWFPLLHLLMGGTWAAIDLCTNNLQMAVAPRRHQASYFAIAAAVAGVGGALGTTTGSFLAQFANFGGLPGLFALSGVLRLIALLPLMFVWEQRSQPLSQVMRSLLPLRSELARVPVVQLANRPE